MHATTLDAPAQRLRPTLIGGRYEILNELAVGGMGRVFRAIDRLSGRVVTVKRLRTSPGAPDADGIGSATATNLRASLAREFRLLASVRHPNIISVLDYGFDDDQEPFLTMDLEENAGTIVVAGASAPLTLQIDLVVQTLRALVYLHRLGIIHRDLKPANILVVRGQVKVLDFGISLTQSIDEVGWAGTPAYMAPELLAGERPSEQSDLFALGMVAYEVLTGRHPFVDLPPARLHQALATTTLPRAQDQLDARVRPVLERLLAADPRRRYRDAREVIGDLGNALACDFAVETPVTRESVLQTTPLVGRDAELGILEAALGAAMQGRGSTWLVAGESGVGKSRVLEELRTRALVDGAAVVSGQAINEGGSPYHVWRPVMRALLLRVEVSDPDADVLAAIVPEIGELLGRAIRQPPPLDSDGAQTRLLFAIEEVFRLQSRPLVVVLEDLHWAGSESLRLLAWLVQTVERLPVLLVGSFRNDEAPALPEAVLGARVLALDRLDRTAIATLGAAMIGPAAHRAEVLDLLERETEGIPFFIVEVVRTLAELSGALDRVGTTELPGRVESGGMARVVRRWLARISSDALPALRTAAVSGRRIDPALLGAVHPELDVDQWAQACARAAVLELRDQHWMFAHDKLREQLVDDLPDVARRAVHRTIAEATERLYERRTDHLAALAHHWREAGDGAREVRYAREAAVVALQTGAYREAVELFLRVRTILTTDDAARGAGRPSHGLRGMLDPNARVETTSAEFLLGTVEGGLSEAYYRLGDLQRCAEHSVRALAHLGQRVPESAAGWIGAALWEVCVRGAQSALRVRVADPEQAVRVASETARVQLRLTDTYFYSLRLAPIVWSTLRVVNQCAPVGALPELAQGYVILARLAAVARMERLATSWSRRALAISERTGLESNVAWVRTRRAGHAVGECRWHDAEAEVKYATEVAERVGDLRLWEEARVQHALASLFRGRFQASLTLFREANRLCRRTGNRQIECWALLGEGGVASRLGEHHAALQLLESALAMIGEDVLKTEAICALGELALVHLKLGNPAKAYETADRALVHIRPMRPVTFWLQPVIASTAETLLSLLEAGWAPTPAIRIRLPLQARQAVAAMQRFARHFPLGRPHAALWAARSAWIGGSRRRAIRLWIRTVALAEQLGTPYEGAVAHLELGRRLAAGSPDRDRHLAAAAAMFERLGCTAEVAEARAQQAAVALGEAGVAACT